MSRAHAYPPDLAHFVEDRWPAPGLPFSRQHFEEALATAFQASLALDEGRPVRFRLLLTPVESLPAEGEPNRGVLRLRFDPSRPLHADELRRLSPSVPFETALIGAHVEDGRLRIWGIAHSGPAWLAPTWGGRRVVPNWTYDPIIHVTGPGELAVRRAGQLVGALERGVVVDATIDAFDSEWLAALFRRERDEVQAEHAAAQVHAVSSTLVEHTLVGRVNQHMIRRAVQLARATRHGGMLLVVDTNDHAPELRGLRLKYRFTRDEPSHRYRTLLLQILEALAAASTKTFVDWSDFEADKSMKLGELEGAVFELSRLVSNLMGSDGAVVLDKRMSLLGFGAEVSAELPTPSCVFRALDIEGELREEAAIENVGTRHRAAYRFANDHPQGLAIVISQDGGVSFVANRGGEVVFWEQSVGP